MLRITTLAVALTASMLIATEARADPVDFEFGGTSAEAPAFVYTIGDIEITVTAEFDAGAGFLPAAVTRVGAGVGVRTPGDGSGKLDSVDSVERLVFTVTALPPGATHLDLSEVVFRNWSPDEDFTMAIDGVVVAGPGFAPPDVHWYVSDTLPDSAREVFGEITFTVDAAGGTDSFRIESFIFASPMPEPGTLALVGATISGLAIRRRRRKRQKQ